MRPGTSPRSWRPLALFAAAPLLVGLALAFARPSTPPPSIVRLPAVAAVGMRTDTQFVGGYARGSFAEAMRVLASDLAAEERDLVGQHLDKIFEEVLQQDGLGRVGRLRVVFERTVRPDGTTRSIRVLAAEAAVAGEMHTAFYYERDGQPGYFDPVGRELEEEPWAGPLQTSLRVTSPFGARRLHPILRRILPHTGVDYAAPQGFPVHATADGVVREAGWRGGYGNLVEIQHPNGYSTRYAHLARISPLAGRARYVRQGEVIGFVGMTGLATGPHLHYEVRRNGRPVDPLLIRTEVRTDVALDAHADWPLHRERLARLLARTPTVLQLGGAPAGTRS